MEYRILTSYNLEGLERLVNEFLRKRWYCLGGVTVAQTSQGNLYLQAVDKLPDLEF